MKQFKKGDVVALKSGGPALTVVFVGYECKYKTYGEDTVTAVHFHDRGLVWQTLPSYTLVSLRRVSTKANGRPVAQTAAYVDESTIKQGA
jgi:uncharacterized protein YodC (DUF2158 family)